MSVNKILVNNNDSNYTHSIFDISEYTGNSYLTLSDALDDVPQAKHKGGMTIRYVQTNDNKYVRYNLIANEFTTDETKWAIDDAGVYVENPEFLSVKLDADKKILWGIRPDGTIYYGAGVPPQVIEYINSKIDELSLDEFEDMVTFLGNLVEGDTLATLLNGKVDKEEGKSLIPNQYIQEEDNPEWVQAITDHEGKILEGFRKNGDFYISGLIRAEYIYIAASDASKREKEIADYVCTGTNDAGVIQSAIDNLYENGKGGTIRLSSGTFYIDSFEHYQESEDAYVSILFPSNTNKACNIQLIGEGMSYGETGTKMRLKPNIYENLNSNQQYKIISFEHNDRLPQQAYSAVIFQDFSIVLPWNQKKVMCIDLYSCNKPFLQRIGLSAYTNGYVRPVNVTNPPDVAVAGCIGLRFTNGSNSGVPNEYKNVIASGFYEGFQVGGEHCFCENLSAIFCVYGYTFGNYNWVNGFNHQIVLINCTDERGVNLPYFNTNGDSGSNSGQMIDFIGLTIERIAAYTPGGVLGDNMKERYPGIFHGHIDYTIQTQYGGQANSVITPLWEDGSGHGFISRNVIQKLSCTTQERLTYAPNYLQHIYDLDLNKEVICIDTANKIWVDCNGNNVDLNI